MPFNITPEFVQGLLDQLKQANEQKQALISQIEALTKLVGNYSVAGNKS